MTGSRPALLYLAQRMPYPPVKGEKIRSFHFLRHLAASHDVHLGCLMDDPEDRAFLPAVRAFCRTLHVAELDRRRAKLACLSGLLTNEALSVTYFRDRSLARWVRDVIERVRPELVFVSSSNMTPYVLDLPITGIRVADLMDVDSEKWRAYADTTRGPMRLVYRRECRRMAALERRAARDFDLSCLVSADEARLLARMAPDSAHRIHGVSNGVDHRYFDPDLGFPAPYDTNRPNYVFTGTMDYKPNVDAVRWFASDILPLIRLTLPEARFHIVGANPSPSVTALARDPGITVTGRVPDVRPYLAHATAAVAPLRIARGIQNKVLEAMAMATPVVTTAGGLEGIEATPGREVILADTAAEFAAACRLASSGSAAAIGRAARGRIVEAYDWQRQLARFDAILARIKDGVAASDGVSARPSRAQADSEPVR